MSAKQIANVHKLGNILLMAKPLLNIENDGNSRHKPSLAGIRRLLRRLLRTEKDCGAFSITVLPGGRNSPIWGHLLLCNEAHLAADLVARAASSSATKSGVSDALIDRRLFSTQARRYVSWLAPSPRA
jgi:hypothetical protein